MKKKALFFLTIVLTFSISLTAYSATKYSRFRTESGIRIRPGVSSNTIRLDNGRFRMYYTDQGIKVSDSAKGRVFTNERRVLSLSQVRAVFPKITKISNSAIFQLKDDRWRMIFEGKSGRGDRAPRRLYGAISADGVSGFVVESGVRLQDRDKSGAIFVAVPDVVRFRYRRLRVYYTAGLWSRSAVSRDGGLAWTKEGDLRLRPGRRLTTMVDADVTKVGRKYVLLFATMPLTGGEVGTQGRVPLQKIYRAFSKKGRNFKLAGLRITLPGANAIDPDMVRRGRGKRSRIYFSRMKRDARTSDILSALYR